MGDKRKLLLTILGGIIGISLTYFIFKILIFFLPKILKLFT